MLSLIWSFGSFFPLPVPDFVSFFGTRRASCLAARLVKQLSFLLEVLAKCPAESSPRNVCKDLAACVNALTIVDPPTLMSRPTIRVAVLPFTCLSPLMGPFNPSFYYASDPLRAS